MTFDYQKELFPIYQGSLVTVEKYVKGKFSKYSVNNNSEMKRTYVLKLKLQLVSATSFRREYACSLTCKFMNCTI